MNHDPGAAPPPDPLTDAPAGRPPGRPRDTAVDAAVLAAARELVVESGYGSVSIEAVARRAGVGRPTIYRRWAGKTDLVFDALFEATETVPVPDTGDVRSDLASVARVVAGDLASPAAARALVAVMADVGADGDGATRVRDETILPRVAELATVVERAQQPGVVRRDVEPDMVLHAIAGVLYYHAAVLGRAMTDELIESVTELLVRGIATPRPADDDATGVRR